MEYLEEFEYIQENDDIDEEEGNFDDDPENQQKNTFTKKNPSSFIEEKTQISKSTYSFKNNFNSLVTSIEANHEESNLSLNEYLSTKKAIESGEGPGYIKLKIEKEEKAKYYAESNKRNFMGIYRNRYKVFNIFAYLSVDEMLRFSFLNRMLYNEIRPKIVKFIHGKVKGCVNPYIQDFNDRYFEENPNKKYVGVDPIKKEDSRFYHQMTTYEGCLFMDFIRSLRLEEKFNNEAALLLGFLVGKKVNDHYTELQAMYDKYNIQKFVKLTNTSFYVVAGSLEYIQQFKILSIDCELLSGKCYAYLKHVTPQLEELNLCKPKITTECLNNLITAISKAKKLKLYISESDLRPDFITKTLKKRISELDNLVNFGLNICQVNLGKILDLAMRLKYLRTLGLHHLLKEGEKFELSNLKNFLEKAKVITIFMESLFFDRDAIDILLGRGRKSMKLVLSMDMIDSFNRKKYIINTENSKFLTNFNKSWNTNVSAVSYYI